MIWIAVWSENVAYGTAQACRDIILVRERRRVPYIREFCHPSDGADVTTDRGNPFQHSQNQAAAAATGANQSAKTFVNESLVDTELRDCGPVREDFREAGFVLLAFWLGVFLLQRLQPPDCHVRLDTELPVATPKRRTLVQLLGPLLDPLTCRRTKTSTSFTRSCNWVC